MSDLSTTQTAVSACDTSNPTNCSCSMTVSAYPVALRHRVRQAKQSAEDRATFYGVTPDTTDQEMHYVCYRDRTARTALSS